MKRLSILLLCMVASAATAAPRLSVRMQAAIKKPDRLGPRLRGRVPVTSGNELWMHTSRRANLFRLTDPKTSMPEVVLRVLDRSPSTRPQRYAAIIKHMGPAWPELVDAMEFVEEGLQVDDEDGTPQWHGAVTMRFEPGENPLQPAATLGDVAIAAAEAGDKETLLALSREVRTVFGRYHAAGAAHGDLTHHNLVVTRQKTLRPIDLESSFVPELAGMKGLDSGDQDFQHPKRTSADFDADIDNFPALVLYASLRALAADPNLRGFYLENNLILRQADFVNPDASPALAAMDGSPDEDVKLLARALRVFSKGRVGAVPALDGFVNAEGALDREALGALIASTEATGGEVASAEPTDPAAEPDDGIVLPRPSSRPGNRGRLVFLIDGSGSMGEEFGPQPGDGTKVTKADKVAEIVNGFINELIEANRPNFALKDRFEVGGFVYQGSSARPIFPKESMLLSELFATALQTEVDVGGEKFILRTHWTPSSDGNTPMKAGYQAASAMLNRLMQPGELTLVVNVSDALFNEPRNDPDPTSAFQEIEVLARQRNALLLHTVVQLNAGVTREVFFPTSSAGMDPNTAKLFDIASQVPRVLRDLARESGIAIENGARLLGIGGLVNVATLIRVGTRAALE